MYLLYFCITLLYEILLPIGNPHGMEPDIGISVNPNPLRLNVIELDVVAENTIVSNDFNIVNNI